MTFCDQIFRRTPVDHRVVQLALPAQEAKDAGGRVGGRAGNMRRAEGKEVRHAERLPEPPSTERQDGFAQVLPNPA